MIALSTIVSAIAAVEQFTPEVKAIAGYVGDLMEATESAFTGAANSGASKLTAVLAAAKAFVTTLGASWDSIVSQITQLIAAAKAAWNAIQATVATA